MTSFEVRCELLALLWLHHRSNSEIATLFETHDLGLFLAFGHWQDLVPDGEETRSLIEEAWGGLLTLCSLAESKTGLILDLRFAIAISS